MASSSENVCIKSRKMTARVLAWSIFFLTPGIFGKLSITSLTEVRTDRISSTTVNVEQAEAGACATVDTKEEMILVTFQATVMRPVTEAATLSGSAIAMESAVASAAWCLAKKFLRPWLVRRLPDHASSFRIVR